MNIRPIAMSRHCSVFLTVLVAGFLMISGMTGAQEDNPLPAPTGPHDVGVEWRHWVDESRDEPYDAETSEAKREVVVGFFYPAEVPEGAEPADYFENRETALPTFAGLMEAFVSVPVETQPSDLDHFESYAYPDAPLSDAEETYPVLIFSHGATGDVRMYASHSKSLLVMATLWQRSITLMARLNWCCWMERSLFRLSAPASRVQRKSGRRIKSLSWISWMP